MGKDYPDYTDVMQIIGSDIMVPMDIQGAYIMMPVDLQAQYVTLEIDIVAQTVGDIAIDIAAQSVGTLAVGIVASVVTLNVAIQSSAVTFNVDITAQTIGNLNFDIKAQSVGIYSQPEWASLQGVDVDPYDYVTVPKDSLTTVLDYTVPGGQTLYINQWGINIMVDVGLHGRLADYHDTTYDYKAINGGRMGAAQTFAKPIKVPAGHHAVIRILHTDTESRVCCACFSGYLVAD